MDKQKENMRTAITLGVRHGTGETKIVAGPGVPLERQEERMRRAMAGDGMHDEYSRLEFWTSNGGLQVALSFRPVVEALGAEALSH